jgi:predicted DCC family thiol-disulfide oxidoreductase YuxK
MAEVVLIYDDKCGLCRGSVERIRRSSSTDAFEFLPCESAERERRFPHIPTEQCLQAMQLVLPSGQVLAGVDAGPEIMKRMRRYRWLGPLLGIPLVRYALRPVYRFVADHRLRCDDDTCRARP